MKRIRDRLTFANVVSLIALFVALGGSAAAMMMITSNSQVGQGVISGHKPPSGKHPNVINGSVNGMDLAKGSVTPNKLNTPAKFTSPNLPQFDSNTGCPANTNSWALTDPATDTPDRVLSRPVRDRLHQGFGDDVRPATDVRGLPASSWIPPRYTLHLRRDKRPSGLDHPEHSIG